MLALCRETDRRIRGTDRPTHTKERRKNYTTASPFVCLTTNQTTYTSCCCCSYEIRLSVRPIELPSWQSRVGWLKNPLIIRFFYLSLFLLLPDQLKTTCTSTSLAHSRTALSRRKRRRRKREKIQNQPKMQETAEEKKKRSPT